MQQPSTPVKKASRRVASDGCFGHEEAPSSKKGRLSSFLGRLSNLKWLLPTRSNDGVDGQVFEDARDTDTALHSQEVVATSRVSDLHQGSKLVDSQMLAELLGPGVVSDTEFQYPESQTFASTENCRQGCDVLESKTLSELLEANAFGSEELECSKFRMGDEVEDSSTVAESPTEQEHKLPKILLVVGECGDGKSTLINALRDPERSGEAAAGLCSRGVTKSMAAYVGLPIYGQPVDYLDSPGVGDTDVSPMKVLTMIEQELIADEVLAPDAIDGVIVTTPIPDGRVKLGAQLVQLLVHHGFVGTAKWESVILVGTKADRATEEEVELFQTSQVDEKGQAIGIAAQFFAHAPAGTGTFVMTSKSDYSQLREAIARLPDRKIQYGMPDPAKMAEAFADRLGVQKGHFRREIEAAREALQQELNAQFAERERSLRQEIMRLQQQHQEESQEQQRQAQLRNARLRDEMEAKLKQKAHLLDELQRATPSERKELERQAELAQQELQRTKEQHEVQQRYMATRLEETQQQLGQLMRELEQEKLMQRSRNYNFGHAPLPARRCAHTRTRNWGNAHGRGRKCIDCKAELGR